MTRGGPPAWGLGVGLTTPHHKKTSLLRKNHISLRYGRIPWKNYLSYLGREIYEMYTARAP
jgi:hypothetical protein